MAILTLTQAKAHLRITDAASDADLNLKIEAAERAAVEYLGCDLYEEDYELAEAIAAVPAELAAAKAVYDASYAAALLIADAELSAMEQEYAATVYARAVYAATRTRQGVVMNDTIRAGILLILGWLFEVREDGESMPRAARDLLHAYRCYA